MEMLAPFWLGLRAALLLAGLLVPGAVLLRAINVPRSLGAAFAGSAVAIYGCALGLDLLGIRLSLASFATALALFVATTWLTTLRKKSPELPSNDDASFGWLAPFTQLGALTPLMLLYWMVIGFLLLREPLAGPDIGFRWAFLPEQWLRLGSLDFYPPVTDRDFHSYFWVESIPPGVASLHAWAFACGGSFAAAWTMPVTALQFLALHDLAWRAGAAAGGAAAARPAAVLVAACPLLNWSVRLGQESGLTAVAALGLAFALLRWRSSGRPAWAAAVGIFAALGAMTREYGLVFPALAFVALLIGRAHRLSWRAFAFRALPLGLAWPVRCALRTGNPFYSLELGDRLPVNRVFVAWITDHRAHFGAVFGDVGSWLYALKWLALGAAPALIGWIALGVLARRHRPAIFASAAVATFIALWLWSVPYTVGGLFYSMRVASPAVALGAVVGGVAFARIASTFGRTTLLAALLIATLPFTWVLPQNPLRTPWREWPAPWRPVPTAPAAAGPEPVVAAILAQHAPVVLTDSPGFQALLAPHGVAAIPFWSPLAAPLFDAKLAPSDALRLWRESGLRVVVLSKFAPAIDFVNRRARWSQPPFRVQLVGETAGFMVLAVEAPP